jgi:hypothetical protein
MRSLPNRVGGIEMFFEIHCDYPYPSRWKSFFYTFLGGRWLFGKKDYLRNAKIIATMINQSVHSNKAYWFFTYKTLPDEEMLRILREILSRHEICLHIVKDQKSELHKLVNSLNKYVVFPYVIRYYSLHGVERFSAHLIWKKFRETKIEPNLLTLFKERCFILDKFCYSNDEDAAFEEAKASVRCGKVIRIHPEWLFQRGTWNHRGRYYEVLSRLLEAEQ